MFQWLSIFEERVCQNRVEDIGEWLQARTSSVLALLWLHYITYLTWVLEDSYLQFQDNNHTVMTKK